MVFLIVKIAKLYAQSLPIKHDVPIETLSIVQARMSLVNLQQLSVKQKTKVTE